MSSSGRGDGSHPGDGYPPILPGLGALPQFEGNYADVLERMLAALSAADHPQLAAFRSRERSDPAIALLDAYACLSEVLRFYHERLLNEGYLRTCTERLSAVELAKLVGYAPRPGVAADAYLAFTLDDQDKEATFSIPAGTKAFSQPGVGETMQPFETVEALMGRPRWSAMKPRQRRPQIIWTDNDFIYLKGVESGLRPGDAVLFEFTQEPTSYVLRKVLKTTPEPAEQRTLVVLQPRPDGELPTTVAAEPNAVNASVLKGLIAPPTMQTGAPAASVQTPADANSQALIDVLRNAFPVLQDTIGSAVTATSQRLATGNVIAYAMRIKAAPRGHNTPLKSKSVTSVEDRRTNDIDNGVRTTTDSSVSFQPDEWEIEEGEARTPNVLLLDAVYDQIAPGSLIAVEHAVLDAEHPGEAPGLLRTLRIQNVETVSPASYNIPGRVTRLEFVEPWIELHPIPVPVFSETGEEIGQEDKLLLKRFREYTIYAQDDILELDDEPDYRMVGGDTLALDGIFDGIAPGRRIIVEGERADLEGITGVRSAELVLVRGVTHVSDMSDARGMGDALPVDAIAPKTDHEEGARSAEATNVPRHTHLGLDAELAHRYRRETVTIYGNVAHATHGESHAEVLGGGNPAKALQAFALRSAPLTFVSAPTVSGIASTLDVRVDDLRWHEAADAAAVTPEAREYVRTIDEDQKSRVTFGLGARLPSGQDNVRAVYRAGLGAAGNVKAGQISVLASRPAGAVGVTNPIKATGGADRDDLAAIRARAPIGLNALDRLVSESDYADFALAFAGVAKATQRWYDRTLIVTIAGVDDAPIDEHAPIVLNLQRALRQFGSGSVTVRVVPRRARLLLIDAIVQLRPDYLWSETRPKIERALRSAFGFDARDFDKSIGQDYVLAAIHSVPAVAYAYLDHFGTIDPGNPLAPRSPEDIAGQIGDLLAHPAFDVLSPARAEIVGAEFVGDELIYLPSGAESMLRLKEATADDTRQGPP